MEYDEHQSLLGSILTLDSSLDNSRIFENLKTPFTTSTNTLDLEILHGTPENDFSKLNLQDIDPEHIQLVI